MNKEMGILLSVGIITIGIVIGVILNNSNKSDTATVWRTDAPIIGNKDGKLKIVEFADFECPACSFTAPVLKKLVAAHPNDIGFQFRHYPLSQHKNALPASIASEIALKNGKFWEMNEILFANQANWKSLENPVDVFKKFAVLIGIDEQKYAEDLKNQQSFIDRINTDKNAGDKLSLQGTPSFYFNGVLYNGNLDETSLTDKVESYLK